MICLTQSVSQSNIQNIEPCGVIRVFAATDRNNNSTRAITEVQKEANRLFPKIHYMFNCKFTIELDREKWACWMIGDGYTKTNPSV